MATSKLVLLGAGVVTLATLGTVVHEAVRLPVVEAEASAADQQYHLAVAATKRDAIALRAVQRQAAELQRQTDAATAKRRPPETTAGTAGAEQSSAKPAADPFAEGEAFLMRHPEVRTALEQWADAHTHFDYWELYRRLGLTVDQIRRFETLMRAGNGFGRDVPSGTLQFRFDLPADGQRQESDLKSLLGADGYDQFNAYRRTLAARRVAENLASVSMETAMPLTPAQAQQVASIFAAVKTNRQQFDWEAAIPKARAVLSPQQFELLQSLRVRAESWQQVAAATR